MKIENYVKKLVKLIYSDGIEEETRREIIHTISDIVDELINETANKNEDNEVTIDQIVYSGKWFIEFNNSADARALVGKADKILKENNYLNPSDINKIVKDLGYTNPVFDEDDSKEVKFNDYKISFLKDETSWRVEFIPTKEKKEEIVLTSNFVFIGSCKNKDKAIEIVDILNKDATNFGCFTKLDVKHEIERVTGQVANDLCPNIGYLYKYYGCAVYEDNDGKLRIGYWNSDSKKKAINLLLGKEEGKKVYPND